MEIMIGCNGEKVGYIRLDALEKSESICFGDSWNLLPSSTDLDDVPVVPLELVKGGGSDGLESL